MKINDTISVNPSKTALGHTDTLSENIFRQRVLGVEGTQHSVDALNIAFPTVKSGLQEINKYAVPLRTLFATILIVTGISLLTSMAAIGVVGFAVCSIAFGAFLALGLLTRPVMLGAAVYYCISGALSLRAGTPDVAVFSLMFGCLIFGITGSGKYSCDAFIRKFIKSHRKENSVKNQNADLGYKAFHNVKF